MRHRLPAAALVLALALAACGDDEPLSTEVTSPSTTSSTEAPEVSIQPVLPGEVADPALAEEVLDRTPPDPDSPPADLAPDALEVTTLIEGEGDELRPGDTVVVHYVAVLADGTVFDNSWNRGRTLETTIPGTLIDGWNEGLVGVKAGERRRLEIGSELGYGPRGNGDIPPNAPLAFEIDVVGIIPR
ncbi:MAG: FKBP-type peptidyl-prolyl cis-trans isomerase [Acidimicrobiia bacterium]